MDPDFLSILMNHNLWATRVLIDRCRELSAEQFHRRFDIGLGSIHDTLRHVAGAMLRWADRLGSRPLRPSIEKLDHRWPPDELLDALTRGDAELHGVAGDLTREGRWQEMMEFVTADGRTLRFRRITAMMHVMTHGMHHRAQVLNMRRQLGLPPLGLDLDVVEWECAATGQIQA